MENTATDKINVREFAAHLAAYQQCKEGYKEPHLESIEEMCQLLPSGSGIDSGVTFDFKNSTPEKLIFLIPYHNMEDGYYSGWIDYKLTITPSLQYGFVIKITGKDKNGNKDYLNDLFYEVFI